MLLFLSFCLFVCFASGIFDYQLRLSGQGVVSHYMLVILYPCVLCSQLSMEKVQAMAEQVEIKAKVVQTEVKALVLRHKKALEERECELLWKVSH